MAATFGVSERVLRRKLVAEGMSFCALRDRVRRNLSELCLMEGKRSIGEIAVLLGYGEISAFTRAHKKWHGLPPRKRTRRDDGLLDADVTRSIDDLTSNM